MNQPTGYANGMKAISSASSALHVQFHLGVGKVVLKPLLLTCVLSSYDVLLERIGMFPVVPRITLVYILHLLCTTTFPVKSSDGNGPTSHFFFRIYQYAGWLNRRCLPPPSKHTACTVPGVKFQRTKSKLSKLSWHRKARAL